MGSIKEMTETLTEGVSLARSIAQKAATRAWTRVLLMALVGSLLMGSYCAYLTFSVVDYRKKADDFFSEYQLLHKENLDKRVLDYIEICIDAQKSGDPNRDYYCNDAVTFYKDALQDAPFGRVEENIRRSAYGAMKVEMAERLRMTAIERTKRNTPKLEGTSEFLLSIKGVFLACSLISIAMFSTAFVTYKLARSKQ
ncbi:hypothetical protein [Pseudomonas sp. WMBT8]|uniref:hypothetical protein n=1 Tax=Pseudomonas sp. WMBT8 TaxID=3414496 RepID=UPI003D808DD6